MRPCFAFTAKTAKRPAVLAINDEIGFWGTQDSDFRNQLEAVDGDLIVEINSPGGDVISGLSMYNMLRARAKAGHSVTTRTTGLAGSIASVVMLAGDKREMPKNSFAMIHAVSGGGFGTADDLRDVADTIEKIQNNLRSIYVDRMGVDEATAIEMMSKDTWLTADECVECGFATEVTADVKAQANFNLERAALPAHVAAVFKSEAPTEPEPAVTTDDEDDKLATPVAETILAEAKTAGLADGIGSFLALSYDTLETARNRMAAAREITALCNVAKKADLADDFIRAGKSVAEARTALVDLLAAGDTQIDNAPKNLTGPTSDNAKPNVVSPTALWASHNAQSTKGR